MANHVDIFDCYGVLTREVASNLTPDNIRDIKFLLRGECGKRDLEKITSGDQLIQLLEERCLLSAEKVDDVSELLRRTGRIDLVTKLNDYSDSAITKNLSNHDYYGLNGMHIKDHYIETSDYRLLSDHMKQKQIAIIQGPPGSWKMQHAFKFAHEFSAAETVASGTTPVVWRIDCNQQINIYNSLSHLMNFLKIQCVHSENKIIESIHTMVSRATETLITEKYKKSRHLFVLFGFISPETALMDDIITHLKEFKNILIIVSVNKTLTGESEENVIKMEGMTETEAIDFLKANDDVAKKDAKILAKKLSYLPDGLLFARTYIDNAKISLKSYLDILERICSSDDISPDACQMVYTRAEENISSDGKKLMRYLPYLNTDNIPIFVLKTLLPSSLSEDLKEMIVNNFLLALNNNSLITIKGVDNDRVITAHAYTLRIMKRKKTVGEQRECLLDLLNYFTYNLDLDARLLEVIHRNVLLVEHVETFLNEFEIFFECRPLHLNDKVQQCYLYSAVGITYRLYGNTELSANSYFQKAKDKMYEIIGVSRPVLKDTKETYDTLDDYLNGNQELQDHAKLIFEKMIEKGKQLTVDFTERFIENKCWSSRTIHLLCKYGKLDVGHIKTNQLQRKNVEHLRRMNLIVPVNDIPEIFIVELSIRLMYNSSKNAWLMEMSKDGFSSKQGKLREQLSSTNLPVSPESLNAQQIAHRLTILLEERLRKAQTPSINPENKVKSFRPIFDPVTKRSGILYMLRSLQSSDNIGHILNDAVKMCQNIDEGIEGIGFVEFGVVKRIEQSSLYHSVMVDCIKMECFVKLFKKKDKIDYMNKAVELAKDIEKKIDELTAFRALSGIHLKIAKVFMSSKTDDIQKAKYHYRRAYDREYECNNVRLTRYHLKAVIHYTECCLQHPSASELSIAKKLCIETQQRLHVKETDSMFDDVIADIDDKLEYLKTKLHQNETDASRFELEQTQMRRKYSRDCQRRIEDLLKRKEVLKQLMKEIDTELDDLHAMLPD